MHLWKRIAVLAGISTLLLSGAAYAETAGITLKEQERLSVEETESPAEEEKDPWYFTKDGFDSYYQSLKGRLEDDPAAVCKLYLLLIGGGVQEDLVKEVLEDGYLTEYIRDFQRAGVLDKSYKLPDGVEKKVSAVRSGGTASGEEYGHEYVGISESAEKALIAFSSDEAEDSAYLNLPVSASETTISGSTLSFTYYNSKPFTVNFLNGEGYADASWHFANLLPAEDSILDLKVKHDEGQVIFALEEGVFPYPATVSIKMESPNTKYNAYDLDGSFRETYLTDRNGYLVMEVTGGESSIRLAKEVVTENLETEAVPEPDTEETGEPTNLSMSGLQVTAVIVVMITMVLFASAYRSEYKRRK